MESLGAPNVFALTMKLLPEFRDLDAKYRLPLIDLAMPALKQLSVSQCRVFRTNLTAVLAMKEPAGLLDWALLKILHDHLDGHFFKLTHAMTPSLELVQVEQDATVLLSLLADAGHQDWTRTKAAFDAAARSLGPPGLRQKEVGQIQIAKLDGALQRLARLKPLAKPQLLRAFAVSVVHDEVITPVKLELVRAVSAVLDCPVPLFAPVPAED
ncbi:MAG: hypothetical protein CMM31_04965 [Rhodospirillaceae bacterium]|nr:hypothetical protein [Rhodospirillaceae bacterium]